MATDDWSSIPWIAYPTAERPENASAWHKHQVPYKAQANALQNIEVWTPNQPASKDPPSSSPTSSRDGTWVIYIHGGAWRDPLVDSESFSATVKELLTNHTDVLPKIAGLASINYSLTCHPTHPTHPAPPPESGELAIPSRSAKHPDHITDVLTALAYLQSKFNIGSNYVLAGHSCGATLAFQVVMDHARWGKAAESLKVVKPDTVLGLNGLYDLPELIKNPGNTHAQLSPLYAAFTKLAFGNDEEVWYQIGPTSVKEWGGEWGEGKKVVLVQSREDSLVPYAQTDLMLSNLMERKPQSTKVDELEAGGDHNELWQKGDRLAAIIVQVVNEMGK